MLRWFVGLLPLLAQLVSSQQEFVFVSVPNMIRVGNNETILINVYSSERALPVTVELKNANGDLIAPSQTKTVEQDAPQTVTFFVDPSNINDVEPWDEELKMYATVVVNCPLIGYQEEKQVLLSFESGFVFIQTDKPIYTPDQEVSIRIIILDQFLHYSDQTVRLDVLSPQGVIVFRIPETQGRRGFMTHIFRFPHEPLFGNWSVVASYGLGMRYNRSVQFEVKEYVLPTFSVSLVSPDHILPSDEALEFAVLAKYVYGHPVEGSFYAKVGVLEFDGEITIKKKIAGQIMRGSGRGYFQVGTNELDPEGLDLGDGAEGPSWFRENKGKRLYVEVSVLETATGISENVSDTSCMFVESPYQFRFDQTVRYYKKGLPYVLKVNVLKTNGKVAPDVPVQVIAKSWHNNVARTLFSDEHDDAETSETTNDKGQISIILYIPEESDSVNITIKTDEVALRNPDGTVDHNANYSFSLEPHVSPSADDFLLIRLAQEFVQVNAWLSLEVALQSNEPVNWVSYYVVSKGTISEAGLIGDGVNPIARTQGFRVRISFDMAPSARVVAFYINQQGQVISDSLWLQIQKVCENIVEVGVKVGEDTERHAIREPDRNVLLQVDALKGTTVGLLAVDKAVYLLQDYHRLTSDKMFSTMDSHDVGCGPGGGRDSPDTFKNAGIMVLSNANLEMGPREAYGCITPTNPRRRRRSQIPDQLWEPFAHYTTDNETKLACKRGLRLLDASLTCEERKEQFAPRLRTLYPDMVRSRRRQLLAIFLECCEYAEDVRSTVNRGRSGGQDNPIDQIEDFAQPANIRSDFKETWIFEEILIDSDDNYKQQWFTIPSSITEWSVTAVGVSATHAMCIADEMNVVVRKDFFVQLRLPYSVIRKEQVEIVVTIFNYLKHEQDRPITVDVFLKTGDEICTEGNPNEFSARKQVVFDGSTNAISVKYVMIGLEVGEHPVTIYAEATNRNLDDAVKKVLRVIPEGVEVSYKFSPMLDPSGIMTENIGQQPQPRAGRPDIRHDEVILEERREQVNIFDIRLPHAAVPDSDKCEVSVIGNVLGPVVTSIIDGLESLLRLPRGCGEQTMIYMAPNVYVLQYLLSVDQTTPEFVAAAKNNIRTGVLREMTHRRADGSYSVWGTNANYPSSTWLTSFVNKVFCASSKFEDVFVDPKIVCQAMEWLIDQAQRADGAFIETYKVHHREMTGGIQGDATLTAFVLISLNECECPSLGAKLSDSKANAISFLESQVDNLRRPYALAIVTYVLALNESPDARHANLLLQSMAQTGEGTRHWTADGSSITGSTKPYWYQVRPSAISVEATGYALLAQLALRAYDYSAPIVKWLSEQQNYGGGFVSTQDTVIALQALSEYAALHGNRGGTDLTCSVSHDNTLVETFNFNDRNALVQRHAKTPARGELEVHSSGNGTGKLTVKVSYNTLSEDINEREDPFIILINAREARNLDPAEGPEPPPNQGADPPRQPGAQPNPGAPPRGDRSRVGNIQKRQANEEMDRGKLIVRVHIEVRYTRTQPTNMAIIDVGLYSGFTPIEEDLHQIVAANNYIQRFEVSQRSVIFYADEIPPEGVQEILEFEFRAQRDYIVGNLQPVVVRVYDYYDPTIEGIKFYHPLSELGHLLPSTCEQGVCVCAAGDCFDCGAKPLDELLLRTCANAQTYAYQVRLLEIREGIQPGFMVIRATILQALKEADDDLEGESPEREFWLSKSCSSCLEDMKLNRWYLIIGMTTLPYQTTEGEDSMKYILDNSALIEFWPERRKRRVREQYDKMQEFQEAMRTDRNNCQ